MAILHCWCHQYRNNRLIPTALLYSQLSWLLFFGNSSIRNPIEIAILLRRVRTKLDWEFATLYTLCLRHIQQGSHQTLPCWKAMSTRGRRQKWTFVKQIWKVLAHGPCRRPRVDLAGAGSTRGRRAKALVWAPQKITINFLKKYWLQQDLNSSLLHESPMSNQLDHSGQLEFEKDNFCLYLKLIKSHKSGPHRVHAVTSFGDIKNVHARTSLQSPCLKGSSQWPQGPWTSWQSPSKDLARSIFHKKNGHFCFPAGCWLYVFLYVISYGNSGHPIALPFCNKRYQLYSHFLHNT
jgi:hypothetical protein